MDTEGTKATGAIRGRAGGPLGGSSLSLQQKTKLGLLLSGGIRNVVYSQGPLRKEKAPFLCKKIDCKDMTHRTARTFSRQHVSCLPYKQPCNFSGKGSQEYCLLS